MIGGTSGVSSPEVATEMVAAVTAMEVVEMEAATPLPSSGTCTS